MNTANGKLRSSALKDELERVRIAIEGCKEDEAAALTEIRSLARRAVGPDGDDALKQCRAAEAALGQARMGAKRLHDARLEIEAELALAISEEHEASRRADAKQAEVFAEGLANLFTEVDRHLAEFRRSYSAAPPRTASAYDSPISRKLQRSGEGNGDISNARNSEFCRWHRRGCSLDAIFDIRQWPRAAPLGCRRLSSAEGLRTIPRISLRAAKFRSLIRVSRL
jgi:hypothetical protein